MPEESLRCFLRRISQGPLDVTRYYAALRHCGVRSTLELHKASEAKLKDAGVRDRHVGVLKVEANRVTLANMARRSAASEDASKLLAAAGSGCKPELLCGSPSLVLLVTPATYATAGTQSNTPPQAGSGSGSKLTTEAARLSASSLSAATLGVGNRESRPVRTAATGDKRPLTCTSSCPEQQSKRRQQGDLYSAALVPEGTWLPPPTQHGPLPPGRTAAGP